MSRQENTFFEFGNFRIDASQRLFFSGSEEIPLPPKVFDTLLALVENHGRVLEKDALLKSIWPEAFVEEGSLSRNISILRKALGESPDDQRYIQTIPKRGYRFVAAVKTISDGSVALVVEEHARVEASFDVEIEENVEIEEDKANSRVEAEPAVDVSWSEVAPVSPSIPWWRRTTLSVSIGITVAALAAGGVWYLKPTPLKPVMRLNMTVLPAEQLTGLLCPVVALSPDGTRLAFLGTRGGTRQFFLRALDEMEAKPIPGTEGALCTPFFSPDGKWLAFYVQGYLKKVSLQGGPPITLCNATGMLGANWGDDDTIVFSELSRSGIAKVSAAGGTPQNITHVDTRKGEANHRYPVLLPGSKAMLFAIGLSGRPEVEIVVQRLDTGERRVLIPGGTYPSYVPTGQLVYVREGTLMAAPFDLKRLAVAGVPVPVAEDIRQSGMGASQFGISPLGSLVYVPGVSGRLQGNTLGWVDRKGNFQPLEAPPRIYQYPRVSPDGQQIVSTIRGLKDDLWLYDIPRGTMTRFTFEGNNTGPLWTPDGKRILFSSNQAGSPNLFWKFADGAGPEEQITRSESFYLPGSVSSNSRLAFYAENHPAQNPDLWVVPLAGERKPSLFLQTAANESAPMISPNGDWLAYSSNESGRFEIYVRAFPGPSGKWQISTAGGMEPVWAPNGRELFYRNGDKMMAVDVTTGPAFTADHPRLLFEQKYEHGPATLADYDVSPDGQRFLMIKEGGQEAPPSQINVVVNFSEELKRRVPPGKP
jgi:Tol biopolymer transport system component/DNA-binding winged helix-turn-helix (wHTH) protein